jgi:hypothetical protein
VRSFDVPATLGAPGHEDDQRGGQVAKTWFDAATWPLEAAVIWIATGDRRLSEAACNFAMGRRDRPDEKRPTLGMWLILREGLARTFEAVDGSLYRSELREGWIAGLPGQHHPVDRAISCVCQMMLGKPATARQVTSSQRTPIPARLWQSAVLVDHRKRGLILRLPTEPDDAAWEQIDVPAAPFRTVKAKRGRHPAGLSDRPRAIEYSVKNDERLKRKKTRADAQAGITPAPRKRGGGRPKGSRDLH